QPSLKILNSSVTNSPTRIFQNLNLTARRDNRPEYYGVEYVCVIFVALYQRQEGKETGKSQTLMSSQQCINPRKEPALWTTGGLLSLEDRRLPHKPSASHQDLTVEPRPPANEDVQR
ncbi:hypothetical protein H1C71_004544, partial [Ictidomys tridecemlineatus]